MRNSRVWYLALGGLMVAGLLLVALFADQITSVSPYYVHTPRTILEGKLPLPPGDLHPLGTDPYGRDIWSRVAFGTRWSLLVAVLIMGARLAIALPMGAAGAFGPRWAGWVISKLYVYTSAVPPLLVYLLILGNPRLRAMGLWPSIAVTTVVTALIEWPRVAVYIKDRLNDLSTEQFLEGAVAAGATRPQIFVNHLLPHLWPSLMQLTSAEMARGLLTIAQLGIFGIITTGTVTEMIPAGESVQFIQVTGVPEWGTLLAEARFLIRSAPWIPLSSATAFLIAVTGFTLLSQGLEGVTVSLRRLREATTGKLDARWRWALLPVAAGLVVMVIVGRASDPKEGMWSLARRQSDLLSQRNLEGYLATLADDPVYREEQRRWLAPLMDSDFTVAVARPVQVELVGGDTITGLWQVAFGYREKPPVYSQRSVTIREAEGAWVEFRGELPLLRGFRVDAYSAYNPHDSSQAAALLRFDLRRIANTADRLVYRASALVGYAPQARERVRLIYHRSHEDYRMIVSSILGDGVPEGKAWYSPRERTIHVSPSIQNPFDPDELDRAITTEMVKYLAHARRGHTMADPVALGAIEHKAGLRGDEYWVNFYKLAGKPLHPLQALFAVDVAALPPGDQTTFLTQSAMLYEWLVKQLPEERLVSLDGDLSRIADALSTTREDLARAYDAELRARISANAIEHHPQWMAEVPPALYDAVLARARTEGMDLVLMDVRVKDGKATVHVLEQKDLTGSSRHFQVAEQTWQDRQGQWQITATPVTEGR